MQKVLSTAKFHMQMHKGSWSAKLHMRGLPKKVNVKNRDLFTWVASTQDIDTQIYIHCSCGCPNKKEPYSFPNYMLWMWIKGTLEKGLP
jgi:hypothetical protein